jgi:hypothetical protein
MTDRLIRREGLISAPEVVVGTCDGCGRTVPRSDLTWQATSWVIRAPDLGRLVTAEGEFTGSLCPECDRLAWVTCWRCGRLTSRLDGACDGCGPA